MTIGPDALSLTPGGTIDGASVVARVGSGGRLRIRMTPHVSRLHGSESHRSRQSIDEVRDSKGTLCSVHSYSGGKYWRPVISQLSRSAGKAMTLWVRPFGLSDFVNGLHPLMFQNTFNARWAPATAQVSGFKLENSSIVMAVRSGPPFVSCQRISLIGKLEGPFENSNGDPRLSFTLNGLLGGKRTLAIYRNSGASPSMGLKDGREFRRIKMIFYDGFRLVLVYEKFREFNTATLYFSDPSELYSIQESDPENEFDGVPSPKWFEVRIRRRLERAMLVDGSSYDHGRLGVEIAYSIMRRLCHTGEFVVPEPSRGGKDLYSTEGRTIVQARLLYDFRQFRPHTIEEVLLAQLKSLLRKLGQDFAYNPKASAGFAALSYVNRDSGLRTILVQRRPTGRSRQGPVPGRT